MTDLKWSILRGARGRLAALYISGLVRDEYAQSDVRRAIEDIDEFMHEVQW